MLKKNTMYGISKKGFSRLAQSLDSETDDARIEQVANDLTESMRELAEEYWDKGDEGFWGDTDHDTFVKNFVTYMRSKMVDFLQEDFE